MRDTPPIKSYDEWLATIPPSLTENHVWRLLVYRQSSFLYMLAWHDTRKILKHTELHSLASQLYRSVGSVGANIAEGVGRNSAKDRIRFYEYALTSATEAQHWYLGARYVLTEPVYLHRSENLASISRQIIALIPQQHNIREQTEVYESGGDE